MSVIEELAAITGPRYVTDAGGLKGHVQDFWNDVPTAAMARVRPGSTPEVSAILALCNRNGWPVVPEGGRTNLIHGTKADAQSILLSLDRLNDIAAPDVHGQTIEAGAGAVIQAIQEKAADAGLRFGLDFGARGSAMLGGALSTNAGGFQALRYGVARDQVLGLECVLADGTIMSHLSPYRKDNTGYDLKHLLIGSEGTLGVITRAVLTLHPAPVSASTALLAFDSFDAVARSLSRLRRDLRGMLSSFEIMWQEFFDFNVEAVCGGRRPIKDSHAFYCLCEAEGFDLDTDLSAFEAVIAAAIEAGEVADAVIAGSSRQRDELWRIREDFEAEQALFSVMIDFDISLPLSVMDAFVEEVDAALKRDIPDVLGLHVLGHLGDGNLHVTTGIPEPSRTKDVKDLVYALIAKYRGSVSAEHGIGLTKRDYLHHSRSPAEISVMRKIRDVLDPAGILNPGKTL